MTDMWMPGAEQRPQDGGVTMNPSLPSRVTWHITWDALTNGQQPSFDGVGGYLERQGYCPHLMWDPWTGRIVQFYPADQGGRALVNWNQDGQYNIQIETFFSPGAVRDGVTYQTVADTPCVGLDQILAWTDSLGIPRTWPMGAPQWEGNSRDPGIWNTQAGHYGHCNVPDNTHTDPGPMPDLNRGIAAMGTITPLEDDMPNFTDDTIKDKDGNPTSPEKEWISFDKKITAAQTDAAAARALAAQTLAAVQGLLNTPLADPNDPKKAYALKDWIVWTDTHAKAIPGQVLNAQFTLPDGTVSNLPGILSAINAKPSGTTNVTSSAPAPFDVDSLVARLKTELPAAVLAELTTKLTK